MAKDVNTVKIAVKMADQNAQLISFDQKRPLAAIIQDLCTQWSLSDPDQYALQFSENALNYITEKNRNEIKNGTVLGLTHSPTKTASDILEKLNHGTLEEKKQPLERLCQISADYTFACEFINKKGLNLLISMVESGTYTGTHLAYTLKSFNELMDHGMVSWDILEPKFIGRVANQVNNQNASSEAQILQESLVILESIVLNSSSLCSLVEQEVTLPNLIINLQSSTPDIQKNAIALINALFLKADGSKRKGISGTLSSKKIRNVILTNIIQKDHVGAEMAHQLYVLQALLLNLLEEKMNTPVDSQDPDVREKIMELRRIAFDTDNDTATASTVRKGGGYAKDYKKLGFDNAVIPAEDFSETPPGILALDNMIHFARNHTVNYTKVVLENSCRADEHECPFGRTSIELTKLLCQILKIGEPPTEQGKAFYPMFFTEDYPFEEFFCICIVLLNKTWKEMRATQEDFVKVFSVFREQITRSLNTDPPPSTLEKFRANLATLTYSKIMDIWQQERSNREEWESQAKPIVELREQITTEIMDLIQQHRFHYLCEGTLFTKYTNKGARSKDKFWYCRLTLNHKTLYYGDCNENTVPTIEELQHKLQVVEIKTLSTGKDCPHMKDIKKNKSTVSLAFSLIPYSDQEALNFVAPSDKDFDYWVDGINALLGNKMVSKETENDLETLISMDIKLRLLDTEGVDIPQDPPPLPKEPTNYDFYAL